MAFLVMYTKAILPPSAIAGVILALKVEVTQEKRPVPYPRSIPTRLAVFASATSVFYACPGALPMGLYCLVTSRKVSWTTNHPTDGPSKTIIEIE